MTWGLHFGGSIGIRQEFLFGGLYKLCTWSTLSRRAGGPYEGQGIFFSGSESQLDQYWISTGTGTGTSGSRWRTLGLEGEDHHGTGLLRNLSWKGMCLNLSFT